VDAPSVNTDEVMASEVVVEAVVAVTVLPVPSVVAVPGAALMAAVAASVDAVVATYPHGVVRPVASTSETVAAVVRSPPARANEILAVDAAVSVPVVVPVVNTRSVWELVVVCWKVWAFASPTQNGIFTWSVEACGIETWVPEVAITKPKVTADATQACVLAHVIVVAGAFVKPCVENVVASWMGRAVTGLLAIEKVVLIAGEVLAYAWAGVLMPAATWMEHATSTARIAFADVNVYFIAISLVVPLAPVNVVVPQELDNTLTVLAPVFPESCVKLGSESVIVEPIARAVPAAGILKPKVGRVAVLG
jgi:hypothetical protein